MSTFFSDSDPVAEGRRRANALARDSTPAFILSDRKGHLHKLDGNARVLVLAGSALEAEQWVRDQGELPFGRRYVLSPPHGMRILEGLRVQCVVTLPGFGEHPARHYAEELAARIAAKTVNLLRIDG